MILALKVVYGLSLMVFWLDCLNFTSSQVLFFSPCRKPVPGLFTEESMLFSLICNANLSYTIDPHYFQILYLLI